MKKLFFLLIYSLMLFTGLVSANNLPPLASFTDDVNRDFFFAGETITFDGSGSIDQDEGGAYITRYRWKIDGVTMQDNSSSLFTTTFSLSVGQSSKTVQVSLEVRDDENTWTTSEGRMTKTYTIRRGQDRHFYLKDHLGSVRVTVDEEGEPIGYDDYYPYGLQMPTRSSNTSNPNDRYKFTGHERDTEAGLTFDYMGARTYDPLLGIFMQIDPLMEFSTPYSYVGGNPVNLTDPTGMSSEDCADRGVGDEFSAEFASPCTRAEVKQAEIEREKDKSEAESEKRQQVDPIRKPNPKVGEMEIFGEDYIGFGLYLMWRMSHPQASKEVAVEHLAFLLEDENGAFSLVIFNPGFLGSKWNTVGSMPSPWGLNKETGRYSWQGEDIIAIIHTHPGYTREDGVVIGGSNIPSTPDKYLAASYNIPCYIISNTGVTYINKQGTPQNVGSRNKFFNNSNAIIYEALTRN